MKPIANAWEMSSIHLKGTAYGSKVFLHRCDDASMNQRLVSGPMIVDMNGCPGCGSFPPGYRKYERTSKL